MPDVQVLPGNGTYEYYQSLPQLSHNSYELFPKKISTSHPLIHTYICLSEVRNHKFSITFSKTFTIIEKEYPYLEIIDSKQI